MKKSLMFAAAAAAVSLPLIASAQFAKPQDAIKYRQAAFTIMATHFGRVGAMVSGKAPWDAKAAQDNIKTAVAVHNLAFAGFVPGSDQGATKAKPEVWSNSADFEKKRAAMSEAMTKLGSAGQNGNQDAIKTAFGAVGQACKACHDDYRAK